MSYTLKETIIKGVLTLTQDDKTIGGLIPLLGIFGFSIVSIILWAVKKDESVFVDEVGKEYLNFVISLIIYSAVAGILCIILIGIVLFVAIGIFSLVVSIIATIKAFGGEVYQYPLIIRFVK
ncbi:MAG: DUF4870 domain-containing protein [Firmicutes bacterium HGW-Firmicutes-1]|nr:MAG: DUF4870 domain-containing protein [Firmicutes bacterium HGW-Firmicutes-1]